MNCPENTVNPVKPVSRQKPRSNYTIRLDSELAEIGSRAETVIADLDEESIKLTGDSIYHQAVGMVVKLAQQDVECFKNEPNDDL